MLQRRCLQCVRLLSDDDSSNHSGVDGTSDDCSTSDDCTTTNDRRGGDNGTADHNSDNGPAHHGVRSADGAADGGSWSDTTQKRL